MYGRKIKQNPKYPGPSYKNILIYVSFFKNPGEKGEVWNCMMLRNSHCDVAVDELDEMDNREPAEFSKVVNYYTFEYWFVIHYAHASPDFMYNFTVIWKDSDGIGSTFSSLHDVSKFSFFIVHPWKWRRKLSVWNLR